MKKQKEQLFKENETPAEKLQILKDNAESTEAFTYQKELSAEEIALAKDKYAQNGIILQQLDEELALIKEDFAARMKPKKLESKEFLERIKHGAETVTETVYLIADQQTGDMNYYNTEGDMVYSRKLMPQEKQTRMAVLKKAVGE